MLAAAMVLAGCHDHPGAQRAEAPSPTPRASATPTPTATPEPGPKIPKKALEQAAKLPLEQRVGQLFLVGFEGFDLSADVFPELRGHGWGGIYVGPQNAFDLAGAGIFSGEARVVAESAKRVVPLVASFDDARPAELGSNPKQARKRAAEAAEAASAQGVTLTTAPLLDVGPGGDVGTVTRVARAAVKAWADGGVAPAPGHFPGQGAVTQPPIDGPANVGLTLEYLKGRDLKPFRAALRDAPAVTVSSATFTAFDPVTPAAHEPSIVRGLLREQLKFNGVAMTDDLSGLTAQTGGSPARAAVKAIRSGIDLVFIPAPDQRDAVYEEVLKAARKGKLPAARVREAAARVLALKAGLK